MDLIKRESILSVLNKEIANTNPDFYKMDTKDGYGDWMHANGFNCGIVHAILAVKEIVRTDAVEVVRCKDCKHRGTESCYLYVYDAGYNEFGEDYAYEEDRTKDDFFCAKGEQREVQR